MTALAVALASLALIVWWIVRWYRFEPISRTQAWRIQVKRGRGRPPGSKNRKK
jgi:hypothetical protein